MFDVSIIIPVYKAKYTIKKTLESINNQKFKNKIPKIELILSIDDNKNYEDYRSILNNEIINIKIDKKYLFISFCSIFKSIKRNLFLKILFGLELESISFNEYLNNEYIFINLIPELVEKNDPPIITIVKNKNDKFEGTLLKEIPILDMLLVNEKKIDEKLY